MEPLPADQRLSACLIWRSTRWTVVRMSCVRTCSGTWQILLLLARGPLSVGLAVVRRWKGLAVGAIHGRGLADTAPDGVGRHKSLRLGRHWGKDAVLVESHAV